MGGPGRGAIPGEKAKDFKGSMKKIFRYMGRYKVRFLIMFIFAIAGTIFNIVGPKILGQATTELFNGLVEKVSRTEELTSDGLLRFCCSPWGCISAARYFPLSRDLL